MYFLFALLGLLGLFLFPLYCCLHVTTPYDRQVDDEQQEAFITNYHE